VYEYEYSATSPTWAPIGGPIVPTNSVASGTSVSLSADTSTNKYFVAIGAPFSNINDNNSVGSVSVYEYSDASPTWAPIGIAIPGIAAGDQSGTSVSLSSDGSIVAIGAFHNDGPNSGPDDFRDNRGNVRVYEYSNDTIPSAWTQIGGDITGEATGDNSGHSVSLSADGTIVAIGAPSNDGTSNQHDIGHVRAFEYRTTIEFTSLHWNQNLSDPDPPPAPAPIQSDPDPQPTQSDPNPQPTQSDPDPPSGLVDIINGTLRISGRGILIIE
jgi:hypothetical protein